MRHELVAYGDMLADKPEIVALNKIDALDAETLGIRRAELAAACGHDVHTISGIAGMGVREMTYEIDRYITDARAVERTEAEGAEDEGYQP